MAERNILDTALSERTLLEARKESGELLLGKRRLAKRVVQRRVAQHPIHLDAYVPNVFAQYVGSNGKIKNVPVTYRDLGRLKESEMLMFSATHLTPTMRARYEKALEDRANAEGHAWQEKDINRQRAKGTALPLTAPPRAVLDAPPNISPPRTNP